MSVIPFRRPDQLQVRNPGPSNLEGEQQLLGAIMVRNDAYHRVSDILREQHFAEPVHQRIYRAVEAITARGGTANPVTLRQTFDQDHALEEVGGGEYLMRLASAVALIFNVRDYAVSIIECWKRRELVTLGEKLIEDACAPEIDLAKPDRMWTPATDLFSPIEEGFHALSAVGVQSGPALASEGIGAALNAAEAVYKAGGQPQGLLTGLADLDHMLGGLYPGDFDVIAGRTSMGKTAMVTSIALTVARKTGPVLFWSGEMSRQQLGARLLAMDSGISVERQRRGPLGDRDIYLLTETAGEMHRLPLSIDDTVRLTVTELRSRAIRMKRKAGLVLIVVDYLQLLDGNSPDNRVQEISKITRDLKALALDLQVPLIALSQLSRAVESRDDKRPQLSDLRESGSIEQDADVVMFCYREEYYLKAAEPKHKPEETKDKFDARHSAWLDACERAAGKADLLVRKNRNGRTDSVTCHFDGERLRFGNLAREN